MADDQYDPNKSPEENLARSNYALAKAYQRNTDAIEGLEERLSSFTRLEQTIYEAKEALMSTINTGSMLRDEIGEATSSIRSLSRSLDENNSGHREKY